MKSLSSSLRTAMAVALSLLLSLLCACSEGGVAFPEYTADTVWAAFRLTVNGEPYRMELELKPLGEGDGSDFSEIVSARLKICEPAALSETVFLFDGNTTYLQAGDRKIPVERELLGGICRLIHVFSLRRDSVVEVKTAPGTSALTSVTYRDSYGDFTVTYTDTLAITAVTFTYRQGVYRLTEIGLQRSP